MPLTTPDARMAVLEFQVKITHESLSNLAIDVREMKDALLQNIASNTASATSVRDISLEVKDLKTQVETLKEFVWKLTGFGFAVSLIAPEIIKKFIP